MDKFKERTGIYHEHQISALCGQHALNNLLQSDIYSVDDLATIARDLDKAERNVLTHSPCNPENMNETGFFSIQVLQQALKGLHIELIPYGSQEDIAMIAREHPLNIQAYICNLGLHWFTIRRFGRQYFELNSMYLVPHLIDDRSTKGYISTVQNNGYSVFIVKGELPHCEADEKLTKNPISFEEYDLLTEDLQGIIMDGKVMTKEEFLRRKRQLKVILPTALYEAYMKNPRDPRIREKIMQGIPKEMVESMGIAGIAPPDSEFDDMEDNSDIFLVPTRAPCNCPNHQHSQQELPGWGKGSTSANSRSAENLTDSPNNQAVVVTEVSQYLVSDPDDDGTQGPPRMGILTTQRVTVLRGRFNDNYLPGNDANSQRKMIEGPAAGKVKSDAPPNHRTVEVLPSERISNTSSVMSRDENSSINSRDQNTDGASATAGTKGNSTIKQTEPSPHSTEMNSSSMVKNSESSFSLDSPTATARIPNSSSSGLIDSKSKRPITSTHVPMMDTNDAILSMVIAESLRTAEPQKSSTDMSLYESLTESYNQQCLEAAIAASLGKTDAMRQPRRPHMSRQPIDDDPNERMFKRALAESLRTAPNTNVDIDDPLADHLRESTNESDFTIPSASACTPDIDAAEDSIDKFSLPDETKNSLSLPRRDENDPSSDYATVASANSSERTLFNTENSFSDHERKSMFPQTLTVSEAALRLSNAFPPKSIGELNSPYRNFTSTSPNPSSKTDDLSRYEMTESINTAQEVNRTVDDSNGQTEKKTSAETDASIVNAARLLNDLFGQGSLTEPLALNRKSTSFPLPVDSKNSGLAQSLAAALKQSLGTNNWLNNKQNNVTTAHNSSLATADASLNNSSTRESIEKAPVSILSTRKNSSGVLAVNPSLTGTPGSPRSTKRVSFALDSAHSETVPHAQFDTRSPTSFETGQLVRAETVSSKPSEAVPLPQIKTLPPPTKPETVSPTPPEAIPSPQIETRPSTKSETMSPTSETIPSPQIETLPPTKPETASLTPSEAVASTRIETMPSRKSGTASSTLTDAATPVTVEELRQRRLKYYGTKDPSMTTKKINYSDKIM